LTAQSLGTETILLVEDEPMVRELAREVLEEYGYRVLTAANGRDGLQVCEEFADRIELIVTDVIMPQMSGRELAEKARRLRPDAHVLYMSGFTDDAVVRHGVIADDFCFIQKPFSPDALARKVREILDSPSVGANGGLTIPAKPSEELRA
jgi:CheY-like chemotaxis protein